MSASLSIALVLTAINNMGGTLRTARQQVQDLGNTYESLKQKQQTMSDMRSSGLQTATAGVAMLAPIESAVTAAGELEYAMKKLEIASYNATQPPEILKQQMKELKKQAEEYGAATAFSSTEVARGMTELIRSGMGVKDVLNGGAKAATYLAQTAEVAPDIAAQSIAKLSNMFGISGKHLLQVADDVNRASNASSAGVQEIMYGMQLSGASASALGLKAKETSLLLGTLYNKGLGAQSGSSLNNLLLALTNVKDQAGEAMAKLGMLKDATFTKKKDGTWKINGGEGAVFNEKGQIKSAQALVNTVRAAFKSQGLSLDDVVDKNGNLLPPEQLDQLGKGKAKLDEIILLFKQAFGEEGMRAAIALAAEGKGSYEATSSAAKNAMNISKQVNELQGTALGLLEQMKGAWSTFNAASGGVVLDEVKSLIKSGIEWLEVAGKWVAAHPELTRQIIRTVAAISVILIAFGGLKLVVGTIGGPLLSLGMGFVRFSKYSREAGQAFRFFRAMGNGIFAAGLKGLFKDFPRIQQLIQRSATAFATFGKSALKETLRVVKGLGSVLSTVARFGAQSIVWLAKAGLSFLRLGVQALLMGARIALAWVIGLGPVGWIIAGVTLLVAGAILAWKTNFMGFRDKARAVWQAVKTGAVSAWNGIKETVRSFFAWIESLPERALKWGSNLMTMFAQGITSGAGVIKSALKGAAGWVANFLGFNSPTKEGPASKSDRWAPNFVRMFADGIYAGIPKVDKSTQSLAKRLKEKVSSIVAKPSILTDMKDAVFARKKESGQKQYIAKNSRGTTIQDHRKIQVTVYAKDANEAEIGVRRAVDDKYVASRRGKKQLWER